MKQIKKFVIITVIILTFIIGAIFIPNYDAPIYDLGNGYTFYNEQDISHGSDIIIWSKIKSYRFNDDFIIVRQDPGKSYGYKISNNYPYPHNYEYQYYWIIVKSSKENLGPLTLEDFLLKVVELGVPKELFIPVLEK